MPLSFASDAAVFCCSLHVALCAFQLDLEGQMGSDRGADLKFLRYLWHSVDYASLLRYQKMEWRKEDLHNNSLDGSLYKRGGWSTGDCRIGGRLCIAEGSSTRPHREIDRV